MATATCRLTTADWRKNVREALTAILVKDMSRALLLAAAAFALTLATGGYWVRCLRAKRLGKQSRAEGPQRHSVKTGTRAAEGVG